jgi:hypothetical protein
MVLWRGGNKLRLISGSDREPAVSPSGITPTILQSIAFSVAGIIILAGAIAEIHNVVTAIHVNTSECLALGSAYLVPDQAGVQLLVAAWRRRLAENSGVPA